MKVTDGVFMVSDAEETVNSAFISTDTGTVVVDTMRTPADGELLFGHISASTAKPIYMLINTHYHADHTFGNQAFDVPTMSTKTTYNLMKERLEESWKELVDQDIPLPLPDITFDNELSLRFSDITLEVIEVGGHAPGTTVVHIPQRSVLIVSDLVFSGRFPFMLDADIDLWISTLQNLLEYDVEYVIPGHGKPGGKELLAQQGEFLRRFNERSRQLIAQKSHEEATEALAEEFDIPSFRRAMVSQVLEKLLKKD